MPSLARLLTPVVELVHRASRPVEVAMIQRDELAARCLVAMLAPLDGDGDPTTWNHDALAGAAVECADALLSRLSAPSSPPSCDAPESPATYVPTPAKSGAAAYVPQVGDVVEFSDFVEKPNARGVVVEIAKDDDGYPPYAKIVKGGESPNASKWHRFFRDVTFVSKATPAELAAAGLPAPTPKVDPEGLERAIFDAAEKASKRLGLISKRREFPTLSINMRKVTKAAADAAIAYMTGGAK